MDWVGFEGFWVSNSRGFEEEELCLDVRNGKSYSSKNWILVTWIKGRKRRRRRKKGDGQSFFIRYLVHLMICVQLLYWGLCCFFWGFGSIWILVFWRWILTISWNDSFTQSLWISIFNNSSWGRKDKRQTWNTRYTRILLRVVDGVLLKMNFCKHIFQVNPKYPFL